MSRSRKPKRNAKPPTPSSNRPRIGRIAAAGLGLGIIVLSACGFLWSKGLKAGGQTAAAVPSGNQASSAPGTVPVVASAALAKLTGKWVRPDGGYVIEIKGVEPGGKLDAAYFNPQPINVSRAQAVLEGGAVKVFIELRAANYPGSTYSLRYDAEADQLKGIYYQAALQQQFEVFFERMK
jgi:hypothetical protein